MVETSCDLYITVQSKELSSIIEKYEINEKGAGRMEYFHDFHTYRFYAIYIDRNDLYNAIPSSDWQLTASVVKWINEIIADIPTEARTAFANCIDRADYIEMIINVRWCEGDEDDECFRGVIQGGKYRFSKKKRSEYVPCPPPALLNNADLSGNPEPCYASEDFKAALDYVAKGERALALDIYQFSNRLSYKDFMIFGLKSNGTVLSEGFNWRAREMPNTRKWNDVIQIATIEGSVFGLKSDGTVISAGKVKWDKAEQQKWTAITSILSARNHIVGRKTDGTYVAYGFKGKPILLPQSIVLSDDWHDIKSVIEIGDVVYGLRNDGVVVRENDTSHSTRSFGCGWKNIKSINPLIWTSEGMIGLTNDGDVIIDGPLECSLSEVQYWRDIVALYPHPLSSYGIRSDGSVIMAGPNTKGQEEVKTWTDIISLATCNNVVGLRKDGTVLSAGSIRENILVGPIISNTTAHLKNIVFLQMIGNCFFVALSADGTVSTAYTDAGKTTSILNSWKLW